MKTLILVLTVLVFVGDRARADEGSPGDPSSRGANVAKLTDEGFALYKARDYRHAAEKFLQAYALDEDPNLLFNMARCYEGSGDTDNAIEKYEAFLAKPDADQQGKRRATDAIRTLRQTKNKSVTPASSTPAMASTKAAPPPANINGAERSDDAGEQDKSSLWSAPVVVLGAGVLVAAAGAIAYAMGSNDHSQVTGSVGFGTAGQVDPMTEAQARTLVQSGDTKKLIGVIGFGVGGALMATSAALFVAGAHHGATTKETGVVAFGVSPMNTGGQFLLQGRF